MSATDNKRIMTAIFDELSRGNSQLFRETLAEDCVWNMIGTTPWSGVYRGKAAIMSDLLLPLTAQFTDRYHNTASRLVAEDDVVVIECRGRVTTKTGKPYHNTYCWVCRMTNGKVSELTEYMDTELVATALEPPPARARIDV